MNGPLLPCATAASRPVDLVMAEATPWPMPPKEWEGFESVADYLRSERPADPVFCFSAAAAAETATDFRRGFPGETTFAVKACPLPRLIAVHGAAGISAFDVASLDEMALVRSVLPRATLHYNNPIRSARETRDAFETFAVRHFTIDDAEGLDRLQAAIPAALRGAVEVSVRLKTARNAGLHDFTSKFGADPAQAGRLMRRVRDAGFAAGATFHVGSQCLAPEAYAAMIHAVAAVAGEAGVRLDSVNVGGGFPLAYPNLAVAPQAAFFAAIGRAFEAAFDRRSTRLVAEPGRALAGPAMSLLTEVKHVRGDGTLFLNDGLYGGLMELGQIDIALPVRVWRDGEPLRGISEPRRVYGPTCDPLDHLPASIEVPGAIAEGDHVEFGLIGAYGLATVTRFNGYGKTRIVAVDRILR